MRRNPFSRKSQKPQAVGTTSTADEAAMVLGAPLVAKLSDIVDGTPGLLDATVSTVHPNDVEDPIVTVIGIVIDTSWSAERYMSTQGQSHDEFLDALMPALREGVTILITLTTLDGTVVYPLTRLQDVKRFGRAPSGAVLEIHRNGEMVKVDGTGQIVAENGMTYGHMIRMFRSIDNTPLRDRVREQITALLAEMIKWENPRVARKVNVISVVLTDGLDNRSDAKPHELNDIIGEVETGGYFTELGIFIGDVNDPEFRADLEANITSRRNACTLPDDHQKMSNEDLLRWWFYEQGLAALPEQLLLPGTDPKAIRRATGQMSQTAYQRSTTAYREEPGGGDSTTTEIPTVK